MIFFDGRPAPGVWESLVTIAGYVCRHHDYLFRRELCGYPGAGDFASPVSGSNPQYRHDRLCGGWADCPYAVSGQACTGGDGGRHAAPIVELARLLSARCVGFSRGVLGTDVAKTAIVDRRICIATGFGTGWDRLAAT